MRQGILLLFFNLLLFFQVQAFSGGNDHYVLSENQFSRDELIVYSESGTQRAIHMRYHTNQNLPDLVAEYDELSVDRLQNLLKNYPNRIKMAQISEEVVEPKFTTDDHRVIWETKEQWDMGWELKFRDWIQAEVDTDFYVRHQIKTDCADVAVSLRWIFSRMHGLAMGFRLAGSGVLFTNESMKSSWKELGTNENWSDDELFRTSLDYITGLTYTHSLKYDSYPVKISPEYFMPGVHHLNLYSQETGHTMFVYRMGSSHGGVALMYSNVPKKVRSMYRTTYFQSYQYSDPSDGGLLKVRWTEKVNGSWRLRPSRQMPGYSLEQYAADFVRPGYDFEKEVLARLTLTSDPMIQYENTKQALMALLLDRVEVVKQGYEVCRVEDCSYGSYNYEVWSTPSRDSRIVGMFVTMAELSWLHPSVNEAWNRFQRETSLEIVGRQVSVGLLERLFMEGSYSSEPWDEIAVRWGL